MSQIPHGDVCLRFSPTRKKTTVPRRHGIHPGESLWKGQSIWSENGHFELTLQLNGDIVIVRKCDDKVIWWTNTKVQLQTAAASMRLHHNGSAALYGDGGEVVWHFPTDWVQFAGSVVRLDNATGSLCLFKNRTCVWLSGGAGPCKPKKDKEIRKTIVLEPGSSLARNVALWSDNGKCHLTSNDCGDIVLTRLCDGAKMWSLGKEKNNSFWICDAEYDDIEVQELILDQDGTLKAQARCFGWLLGINMTVTRILGKSLTSKAKLLLGNDCRLCLFENGRCYWLSGTFHNFCITSARNTTSQPSFTQAADFDADDLNSMPETNSGANSAQLSSTPHLSVTETSRAEFRRYELRPNESLWQGQSIWSRDGQIQLTLQLDGNLVIRRKCDDTIVWAMNRKKHMQPAASMRLHHNGSIALYSTEDGLAVGKLPTDWEEFEGSVLRLDDATGSLCLFKNGTCVWLSGGAGLCRVKAEENIERGIVLLTSGSTLGKNTSFWSVNKECMLTWNDQDDLRLFRSCDGAEIWSFDIRMEWVSVNVLGEQLESLSICHWSEEEEQDLILQHDGSLIIRATCAKKTKNTHRIVTGIIGKARTSAAKLMLGNDCRLCLFEDGGCYWSSSSYHNYCFASPRQTTFLPGEKHRPTWNIKSLEERLTGTAIRVEDDGSLCLFMNQSCLWKSGGELSLLCQPIQSPEFASAKVLLTSGKPIRRNQAEGGPWSKMHECKLDFALNPLIALSAKLTLTRQCDGAEVWSETLTFLDMEEYQKYRFRTGNVGVLRADVDHNDEDIISWSWSSNQNLSDADLRLSDACQLCVYKDGACLWVSSWHAHDCPRETFNTEVKSGAVLLPGQSIWSPNKTARLLIEQGGGAVVVRTCDGEIIWSSYTRWNKGSQVLFVQPNGLFHIHQRHTNHLLWVSYTIGPRFAEASLRVEDGGSLCLYKDGECLWKSGGSALCHPVSAHQFDRAQILLLAGETLSLGQQVRSKNQQCSFSFQPDSELTLRRRCDNEVMWSIRRLPSYGSVTLFPGRHYLGRNLTLEADGSLILWGRSMIDMKKTLIIWQSNHIQNLDNITAPELRLTNKCEMCVYYNGSCLWTASFKVTGSHNCSATNSSHRNSTESHGISSPTKRLFTPRPRTTNREFPGAAKRCCVPNSRHCGSRIPQSCREIFPITFRDNDLYHCGQGGLPMIQESCRRSCTHYNGTGLVNDFCEIVIETKSFWENWRTEKQNL